MATNSDETRSPQSQKLGALLFPDTPSGEVTVKAEPCDAVLKINCPHQVMISYCSEDMKVAHDLCAVIESYGIKCWIAPRDIVDGEVYASAIVEAIQNAEALVSVFSHDADKSRHVLNEVATAFDLGLPIFTLKIDNVTPCAAMSYYLRTVQWEVVSSPSFYQHFTSISQRLKTIIMGS